MRCNRAPCISGALPFLTHLLHTMNLPATKTYRIAVIAGDGIGKEVMPEGLRATLAAAERFGLGLELHTFEWACCDFYAATAR